MMIAETDDIEPETELDGASRQRLYPVTHEMDSGRFFVRMDGQWVATPLFLALILIETSDILFAVDSIPAVFAVTHDPFLVFTSNIFAILGFARCTSSWPVSCISFATSRRVWSSCWPMSA